MAARKSRAMLILLLGLLLTSWFNIFGHARKVVGVDTAPTEKGLKDAGADKGTKFKSGEAISLDNYKGSVTLEKSTLRSSNANGQVSWVNVRHMVLENNKPIAAHLPEEVEDAGFTSTADYTAPRHHPPKNN